VWAPGEYRRDRRLHYREEMIKKLSVLPGATAESVLAYVREEEKKVDLRRREGLRLGGMITSAAGIALMVSLYYVIPDMPVYLVGLLPTLVGLALISFAEIGKGR